MPTYDYECDSCKHSVEQVHRINENPPKTECPCCGGKLTKLISAPTFVLKGEGWANSSYSKPTVEKAKKAAKKST